MKIVQYFELLTSGQFEITDISLKKLDTPDDSWAHGPYAEVIYSSQKQRRICVQLYENGGVYVGIKDYHTNKAFSYDHYISYRYKTKPSLMYTERKRDESYADYYINLVKASFEGELKEVILGNAWIDVPFDWQGLK